MSGKRSIAVIYASEGTGHKSAAFALREAFLAAVPEGKVLCRDILDFVPQPLKHAVSGGYLAMARYAPWLWGRLYWGSDRPGAQAAVFEKLHSALCRLYLPRLRAAVRTAGAEAVIFTHYFGASEFAAMYGSEAPVCIADTDFESHRFQRSGLFALSFAGSARSKAQREAEGIYNVVASGVPVAGKFSSIPARAEARGKLGVPADARAVLVSGGGIGAGPVRELAASLARRGFFVLAVCGANARLAASMRAYFSCKDNVRVEGFVDDMEYYYAASDAAVMKPGGLSSSEALCAGLPMLLASPVPGQEELNLAYLTENGAARRLAHASRAAEAAEDILESGAALEMRRRALALARPHAAEEIIKAVLSL